MSSRGKDLCPVSHIRGAACARYRTMAHFGSPGGTGRNSGIVVFMFSTEPTRIYIGHTIFPKSSGVVLSMSEAKVLQSWKEIAHYVNRGVRTVQRWEALFGLPVHR